MLYNQLIDECNLGVFHAYPHQWDFDCLFSLFVSHNHYPWA